jgi:mono/diheme cytochrome c family protein
MLGATGHPVGGRARKQGDHKGRPYGGEVEGSAATQHARKPSEAGERKVRRSTGTALLAFFSAVQAAAAQPFPAADTLTPQQLQGRNLFNQSCMVCHVKLQITSPAKYGPDLSRNALSGQEALMRDVISNGTPNMPGFKYHFEPGQIDAIVSYLKALPAPAPSRDPPR